MKKYIMLLLIVLLSACGQDELNSGGQAVELLPIEVELVAPLEANTNEEITFEASVTQGEELVDDADEVLFEIWLEGQKESGQTLEPSEQEENNYFITHTFTEPGTYHVQAHVTARELHRMPVAQITISEEPQEQAHAEHDHENDSTDNEQAEKHEHQHHHGEVEIDAQVVDSELLLSATLDGSMLKGAKLTIEVKDSSGETVKWLDLSEKEAGIYVGSESDLEGPTDVVIHIVKDEFHEHVEKNIAF
ncbi:FixH family protein [Bacillus suaedae]|uniref:FixH family protein n=1 Tax=Halalkalibacter suaedae TaxID=2822140 RepID=A0A940WRY2_9BACI|nr:FixH family protein [Bacillus suaedae]MBP3951211.1 FixH family protein [Bacillus suaedae]